MSKDCGIPAKNSSGEADLYRIFLIGTFLIMAGVYTNSAVWFRMKVADHYMENNQYAKAIRLYEKILRKDKVKPRLGAASRATVNFEKGNAAEKLGLSNLAAESYAAGSTAGPGIDLSKYRSGKDLAGRKLLAIGMLEAGRFDAAIEEFRGLRTAYPDFEESEKYINTARDLKKAYPSGNRNNFLFSVGDAYIHNQLFDEARAFYAKRLLDYGVDLSYLLEYLNRKYSGDNGIMSKVWGGNIYVVLEDFETVDTRLNRSYSSAVAKVNVHRIAGETAYKGKSSEFLEVDYAKEGYDYWMKDVSIPLDAADLKLGLRMFVKGDNLSGRAPLFWVAYNEGSGSTGILSPACFIRDLSNGWREWRLDNIYDSAKLLASERRWRQDKMVIEKIIIDMRGIPGKFYIDDIELFIAG